MPAEIIVPIFLPTPPLILTLQQHQDVLLDNKILIRCNPGFKVEKERARVKGRCAYCKDKAAGEGEDGTKLCAVHLDDLLDDRPGA